MLLRANDGTWAAGANPANQFRSCETPVLLDVRSDAGSCSTKASLAMNSNSTRCCLTDLDELLKDVVRGCGAVQVVHVDVVDTSISEALLVVVLLVESDDECDVHLLEVRDVVVGTEGVVSLRGG